MFEKVLGLLYWVLLRSCLVILIAITHFAFRDGAYSVSLVFFGMFIAQCYSQFGNKVPEITLRW